MLLVDARRLTGPNLLARAPLVIVEIALDPADDLDRCVQLYSNELERMRSALRIGAPPAIRVRPHQGGAVFSYEAPVDVMLAWVEMSEWAVESAASLLRGNEPLPLEPKAAEVAAMFAHALNPRMMALAAEAQRRHVPFLWDDTLVSVGQGNRSATFPRDAVPEASTLSWDSLGPIPVALITGTNGKTTSSRLLARVACEAGFVVGSTSTDGITVGGTTVEQGDWTGPAAARTVLRRNDVAFAVLETARGGILRRGLAMNACDTAIITNVSDDHFGDYGIDDLAAMTQVKGVIAQAVREGGTVVLNAHDQNLVALAATLRRTVAYFADLDRADDAASAVVQAHLEAGGWAVVARNETIVRVSAEQQTAIVPVVEVPITFGGAARYNVQNALGVTAAALALGLPANAIARALRGFGVADNPGRGQLLEKNGVRIMLDFGHNPEGVRSVMQLVAQLRADRPGRLTVVAGSAGDRSNREIEDMAAAILQVRPDRVFVRDLGHYLRGREPGEVPQVFLRAFAAAGFSKAAFVQSEVAALEAVLAAPEDGEFAVILAHVDHNEVIAFWGSAAELPASTRPLSHVENLMLGSCAAESSSEPATPTDPTSNP